MYLDIWHQIVDTDTLKLASKSLCLSALILYILFLDYLQIYESLHAAIMYQIFKYRNSFAKTGFDHTVYLAILLMTKYFRVRYLVWYEIKWQKAKRVLDY